MSKCNRYKEWVFMEEVSAAVSEQVRPFDSIRKVDPANLLGFIQAEHPQTIALILSYLDPGKASFILERLPHDIQGEVARRITIMDRIRPEILRRVERALEEKLSTLSGDVFSAVGGVNNIVEILHLLDRASGKQIIKTIEDEDPELAEEIKNRMLSKPMLFFRPCKLWWNIRLHSVAGDNNG